MNEKTKKCPWCGEMILAEAKKCRFCGEFLEDGRKSDNSVSNNTSANEGQVEPLTAAWLRANTSIRGWFAFFIFALAIGGLISLVYPFATYEASDYVGSSLLGMTDITMGVVPALVAVWSIVSLCRRSPAAVFWAKYYTVLVLLTNGFSLWLGDLTSGDLALAVREVVWAIVWFLYLTFSQQVKEVIPKGYRRVGVRTWACAGLLLLVPLFFFVVGVVDVIDGYQYNVEIVQSELPDDELTDGHVVFDRLDGWSFGMSKEEGITVCSFTNEQEIVMTLGSVPDADDSRENFIQTAASCALADFEQLPHRIVRDDTDTVNGHVRHYRIVRYERENAVPVFWHFACLFDAETVKAVVVNGYFLEKDVPAFDKLQRSVRFKK